MKIYKDGVLWYECISPEQLLAMQQTIANNLQNNYYTNVETMSLIASSRAVYQVATMPSTPTRNTIYYVGSTNPYNVKLVDSNGTVVDLGSSDVDLSGYQPTTDRVSTLNYTADDTTYPTTTAVFTETPQVRAGHLTLNSVTTMDELLEGLFKDGTVKYGNNTTKKAFAYVKFGSTIGAMLPAIAGASTSFNNGFVEAEILSSTMDSNPIVFATIKLRCVYSNVTVQNIKGNNGAWSGWQVVNGDVFAPINAVVGINNASSTNPNDCVFNFVSTNSRILESKRFADLRMADPITNKTMFGAVETEQTYCGTYIMIDQTFYCYYENDRGKTIDSQIKFKRKGYIDSTSTLDKNLYDNRANITWNAWYPIEYPLKDLSNLINTTDFNDGQIAMSVSGGVAIFDLYNINPKSTAWKNIIVSTTFQQYSKFFKANTRAILGNVSHSLNGGIMVIEANRNSSLKCITVGTANNNYNGQLVATLGY